MTHQDQPYQSNIWKLYIDRFFSSFWLFLPILVPLYESNGLSATEIFTVQAAYAAAILIFEVPSGYLSDAVGRKKTMIMGSTLLPIAVLTYVLSSGFWSFVLAEIIIAAGNALRSGTDSALLYETLDKLGRKDEYKRIEGTCHFINGIGMGTASMCAGLLTMISLTTPLYINILTALILLPLALSVTEPNPKGQGDVKKMDEHIATLGKALQYCATHKDTRRLIAYAGIITGFGLIAYWSYFLFFKEVGIDIVFYGFFTAGFALLSACGAKLTHTIEEKIGVTKALFLPLIIPLSLIALSYMRNYWGIAFILIHTFLWGFSIPLLKDHLQKRALPNVRATILSVMSMAERVVYVSFAFMFGYITDHYSLQQAYMGLGIIFLLFGAIIILPFIFQAREPALTKSE